MKRRPLLPSVCLVLFSIAPSTLIGQEIPASQTQKEHEWLRRFAGQWTTVSKSPAIGDQPAVEVQGSVNSRMLGGLWVVNEMKAEVAGVSFEAVQTIGYDPEKKKYVGTWVDSMMNHMWRYEGTLDESGKKLSLEAEGPDITGAGKTARFRDSYEFKTADLVVATSQMQDSDGNWVTIMTGEMKRK